jgi:regulator of sigma E protease
MLFDHILSGFQSTGIFIIIISILILVHEWGHFITAKKLGITVEKFSLGFGPKLFSKVYHGTEYLICLIPLGGYVKMAGDEREQCTGAKGEFHSQPIGHKALVVLNGPVVNYLLAYVCLALVFLIGYQDISGKVNDLMKGYPAQEAGIQVGDEILAVEGKRVYGWTELNRTISDVEAKEVELTILRNGKRLQKTVRPKKVVEKNVFGQPQEMSTIGIRPYAAEVGSLDPDGPAKEAGLEEGDRIIRINEQEVQGWTQMQKAIEASGGELINITFMRDGKTKDVSLRPKIITRESQGEDKQVPIIGITPHQEIATYNFGPIQSLVRGAQKLMEITTLTYKAFYFMIVGSMSPKESVTGPIGIFYFVKSAAETGLSQVLFVLGLISASLAIFNLLPVIPLDGGHLFLFLIEKLRGKALPPKVEDAIIRTGFSLIMLLALFVFYTDFVRFGWIENIKQFFH